MRPISLIGIALATSALATGSCAAMGDEITERHFDDYSAAESQVGNWLPDWLPKDATNIRVRYQVDVPATAVAWQSRAGIPANCTGSAPAERYTAITEGIIPEPVPKMVSRCDDEFAFRQGDTTYAWQPVPDTTN